jgi:putative ABC transport system permease protein
MYVLKESFKQAFQQLLANKLRSFLSLLGIMIGIFCIIAVKSAIDSLEDNIRQSLNRLGNDVIYIQKMPWNEDPGDNYWKYARRPNPGYKDYRILTANLTTAKSVAYSFFAGMKTIKFNNNSVERTFCVAITEEYDSFHNLEYEAGRFFSPNEYRAGTNTIILGYRVAKELFKDQDPIGKTVKYFGRNMIVVGVLKQSGKDLLKFYNYDDCTMLGFETVRGMVNVKPNSNWGGNLQVKAADGVSEQQLKDDVVMTLRKARYLKPREENNFSLNSMTILADLFTSVFGALSVAGWVIGGFALIVGVFSVANIMFVSVKERTGIIGIKKALGAKANVILLEFLIESVVLCLLGGLMGLIVVWLALKGMSAVSDFEMYISYKNMLFTFFVAAIAGIIAGIIPARQAAKMDPVEAIRA